MPDCTHGWTRGKQLREEREELPFVSIVLPCRNESRRIAACLRSLVEGSYPSDRLEILVADGMSTDGTRDVIEAYASESGANIRVLENSGLAMPYGANLGLRAAQGDVLFVLNSHSTYSPEYVARCVEAIDAGLADCVGGIIRYSDVGSSPWSPAIRLALTHPFGVGGARYKAGRGTSPFSSDSPGFPAARRDVWATVGLFNEALRHSQDYDLFSRMRRAGYRIAVHPGATATYYARDTLIGFLRYVWRNGRWVSLPWRLTRTRFAPRHFVPAAAVGVGATLLATAPLLPPARVGLAVLGALYALAAVAVSLRAAIRSRRARLLLMGPIAFFLQHSVMGVATWFGLVEPIDSKVVDAARNATPPSLN